MPFPKEAKMKVRGVRLTEAQVMTLRVALNSFYVKMKEPGVLGVDPHGVDIAAGYALCCDEILRLMSESNKLASIHKRSRAG